jgi:hypothetical protein
LLTVVRTIERGAGMLGVEVRTSRTGSLRALARFEARFPGARTLVVGSEGVPLEGGLSRPAAEWM